MADVPMYVISENASSERRITPSWTIDTFKTKLEPITGIPPSAQRLSLKSSAAAQAVPLEAADEENTFLNSFPLVAYGEIHVSLLLFFLFLFLFFVDALLLLASAAQHGVRLVLCICARNLKLCLTTCRRQDKEMTCI